MKIGIIGSRGIPNTYGGFEQFAEHLSIGLVQRGAEVWVYNSHKHSCQEAKWNGVNRIMCYDPEDKIGTTGQFIYDLNCINDCRKRGFDIILQLGYTSNSVWHWRLPIHSSIITNMDGLEWKRSKYSKTVRKFLKYAEKLAVKSSDSLVADSVAIQDYLKEKYGVESVFIPYGADVYIQSHELRLHELDLIPQSYYLLIARMQPDNHIEEVIKGFIGSESDKILVIVGNIENAHGRYLVKKFRYENLRFAGAVFDQELLNQLRYHCCMYFHGHSSGGTNPSLLEAMAASAFICAHDNAFNRAVLGNDAVYFCSPEEIRKIMQKEIRDEEKKLVVSNNLEKIKTIYTWDKVIDAYYRLFMKALATA